MCTWIYWCSQLVNGVLTCCMQTVVIVSFVHLTIGPFSRSFILRNLSLGTRCVNCVHQLAECLFVSAWRNSAICFWDDGRKCVCWRCFSLLHLKTIWYFHAIRPSWIEVNNATASKWIVSFGFSKVHFLIYFNSFCKSMSKFLPFSKWSLPCHEDASLRGSLLYCKTKMWWKQKILNGNNVIVR
jgi:hypothetical protein